MRVRADLMPLSRADYARVLRDYANRVSDIPGVVAGLQFGATSTPGVSDIDSLVVVHDDISAASLAAIVAATRTDDVAAYLFPHAPIIVPRSVAPRVAYVHTLYNLRTLWGSEVDIQTPRDDERVLLDLAEYIDFTFAVRTVLRALHDATAGLRTLLLLLTSCVHSLRLGASLLGEPVDAPVAERVGRLREACVRTGHGDGAPAAAVECVEALRDTDYRLEAELHTRGITRRRASHECVCHSDGHFYLFETPFPRRAALRAAAGQAPRGWWRLLRVDPSVEAFPGFYLAQFAAYGAGEGTYAAAHRAAFGRRAADNVADAAYRRVLTTRVETVQQIHDVLGRAGLAPMVPLGIGFRAPERIRRSRRRRLLRPLVARRAMIGRR